MTCRVCDAHFEGDGLFCGTCKKEWEGSPEWKRSEYFASQNQPGPARTALADFIDTRRKIRQNSKPEPVAATATAAQTPALAPQHKKNGV